MRMLMIVSFLSNLLGCNSSSYSGCVKMIAQNAQINYLFAPSSLLVCLVRLENVIQSLWHQQKHSHDIVVWKVCEGCDFNNCQLVLINCCNILFKYALIFWFKSFRSIFYFCTFVQVTELETKYWNQLMNLNFLKNQIE